MKYHKEHGWPELIVQPDRFTIEVVGGCKSIEVVAR